MHPWFTCRPVSARDRVGRRRRRRRRRSLVRRDFKIWRRRRKSAGKRTLRRRRLLLRPLPAGAAGATSGWSARAGCVGHLTVAWSRRERPLCDDLRNSVTSHIKATQYPNLYKNSPTVIILGPDRSATKYNSAQNCAQRSLKAPNGQKNPGIWSHWLRFSIGEGSGLVLHWRNFFSLQKSWSTNICFLRNLIWASQSEIQVTDRSLRSLVIIGD